MINENIKRQLHSELLKLGLPNNSFVIEEAVVDEEESIVVRVFSLGNVNTNAPKSFEGYPVIYMTRA